MSAHNNLQEFIQKLQTEYNRVTGRDNLPAVTIEVSDTVYYRTFNLLDFYEYDEQHQIEPGSIQFEVTVFCGDILVSKFRLINSPLIHTAGLIRFDDWNEDFIGKSMELVDILATSLKLKIVHCVGYYNSRMLQALRDNWTELQAVPISGGKIYVYSKTY